MSTRTFTNHGLTRRSFVAGSLAAASMIALAGREAFAADSAKADASTSADAATGEYPGATAPDAAGAKGAAQGGTVKWYLTNPVAIEPFGAEENQGVQVMYGLFDTLTTYDWGTSKIVPLAAESYESNADATQFTFHLRKEATWHDGKPVVAADYKYAWERLCKHDFKPAPSSLGYKLNSVKGAAEMQSGTGDSLDIETPDDYTLVVNLAAPNADFPAAVADYATAPVPNHSTDDEAAFQAFRVHPVGNGPFQMDGDWADGQYINIKRYDGYWGEKPLVDGFNFQIFKDDTTAWTEFSAGNLDYTTIPSGQFEVAKQQYGVADQDGYVANPGKQVLNGEECSIYYFLVNNNDEVLKDKNLRIAMSYAINRKAICDSALQGTKSPASNMLAPGIAGYEDNAWDYCPAEGDKDKAKEFLDKSDYVKNGSPTLQLSFNTGSANESILTMIQADLAAVGINGELNQMEWAAYIDSLQGGDYQAGRLGWTVQVPVPYMVLQPLFYTGSGDNKSFYSNKDFDAAIDKAQATVDDDERTKAYQEANKIAAEDFPVIPLFYYTHTYIASKRVNNLYLNPLGYARLQRVWLTA